MRVRALLILSVVVGCSHDLSQLYSARNQTKEADALFAAADFVGARDKYRKVLVDYPDAPNALFGAALSDLLLLGASEPARELAALCGQAPPDLPGIFFGPRGIIAQTVEASEGEATLTVNYFSAPGEAATKLGYAPTDVRARLSPPSERDPRHLLSLTVRERGVANSRWLQLQINVDDVSRGDDVATPLADGVEVELASLAGYLDFIDFSSGAASGGVGTSSGKLRFVKAGLAPGDALELELVDVKLPAPGLEICGGACGPAWYAISGRISDRISPEVEVESARLPFGDVSADAGPPRRATEIVALELCSPLDDRAIAERVRRVAELVEADATLLATLLASPEREGFDAVIPAGLFRAPADLPVNLADVRALEGMLSVASGLAELAAQYRWLAGDIQAQIEEHDWAYEGEGTLRARVFWPATLAMALETGFFEPSEGFDLTRARERLRRGTSELSIALGERPTRPGLFDFGARPSARLVGELAGVLGALSSSIDAEAPVPIPSATRYTFHLRRLFESPLDADRVRQLAGLLRLWRAIDGDPEASSASDRNPELSFELDVTDVRTWSDGLVSYPPIDTGVDCSGGARCEEGSRCDGVSCKLDPPWFATEEAWRTSSAELDWPAFVGSALRDALAVDL